jgi:hypothetical protein
MQDCSVAKTDAMTVLLIKNPAYECGVALPSMNELAIAAVHIDRRTALFPGVNQFSPGSEFIGRVSRQE